MICNLTNKKITEVMTFGKMPLANGFLYSENILLLSCKEITLIFLHIFFIRI